MKRLVIYYIATSNYKMGLPYFIQNIHHFFPQFKKTVVILSDGLDDYDGKEIEGVTYKVHHIHHFCWPIITLFKMTLIRDFWEECDYACYFNGNMQCNKDYDYNNSNYDFDKLNCAWHVNSTNVEFDGSKFANISNNSVAFINEPYKYIHGGYFFGPSDIVKEMCNDVSKMVEEDLKKNVIPQWHDESYLNKWCVLNKDKVNKKRFVSYQKYTPGQSIAIIETIEKDRRTTKRFFK